METLDKNIIMAFFAVVVLGAFIVGFMAGHITGYKQADEKADSFCSNIFSKINVDTIDMEVNMTKMFDWMESRGYELGCSDDREV